MKTKTIHKPLLSGGLFDKPFMDSRATTQTVSTKEWVLGHLIGPLGLIFVVNTIAALVEKFFTQQTGAMYGVDNIAMIMKMGGVYEVVMTVAKILAMGTGLLNGWLIQHTQCRQGRIRPWYLIFGFISIIIGSLIFLFPGNTLGEAYWYYFFFLLICYHTIGSSYFYLFRDTICSLTTRSPREKAFIQYIRKMSWTLISGIIIGMLLNMVALPMWLEKDITGYPKLMLILSVIAIPLLLLEYFYTRERITEDVTLEQSKPGEENIPLKQQLKALFSNKNYVILLTLTTIGGIVDNFKGGNVQYFYIKFLLGGAETPPDVHYLHGDYRLHDRHRRIHHLSHGQKIRHQKSDGRRVCHCIVWKRSRLDVPESAGARPDRGLPAAGGLAPQCVHFWNAHVLRL